jgi:uncharacterized protein YggE
MYTKKTFSAYIRKFNRTYFYTAILLLFNGVYLQADAQISGNIMYNESTRWQHQNQIQLVRAALPAVSEITFEINAMFNVAADSYVAIFHATQMGGTAIETDSLMSRRVENFRSRCLDAGIKEEDFRIDMLSMVPAYEVEMTQKLFSRTYTEIPIGFELQKNIHIKFKDTAVLDKVMTAAAINEIYDLIKVDYFVKNHEAVYDSLRSLAVKLIHDRIDQYESLGIPVEKQWRMASDRIGVFYPLDRYTAYRGVGSTSLEAIQKRKRDEVQVASNKQSSTVYYNKLPYTNYDIIVNPEILEPAVQDASTLQFCFKLEKEKETVPEPVAEVKPHIEKVVETRYVMITEDGNFKELQLTK